MPAFDFTIIGEQLEIGTRAHWDSCHQALYYVDVETSYIYKYVPSTETVTRGKVGLEPLAFAFPVKKLKNQFIGGLGRKFVLFNWNGKSRAAHVVKVIGEVDTEPELAGNRLNGGRVDPFGRLWAGTMGPQQSDGSILPRQGSLYSVDKGQIKKHLVDIGISNGLAWDLGRQKMYYVDTMYPKIFEFDYNADSGEIDNRQVTYQFEDERCNSPDGLTIDCSGCLWVAMIYGSKICKIDPILKNIVFYIHMQTPQITSIAFGDEDLKTLYATTAQIKRHGIKPEYPAGCLFKIRTMDVEGVPCERYEKAEEEYEDEGLKDQKPITLAESLKREPQPPHYVF